MKNTPRVLAVASAGGHWMQLFRLRKAWDGCAVTFLTTDPGYRSEVEKDAEMRGQRKPDYFTVLEANRWQKTRLLIQLLQIVLIVLKVHPHVVITTGASMGYFAIRVARLLGARTVWVDSVANAEKLSLSGEKSGRHADLWLTQWEHLAAPDGPHYHGSVL